MMTTTTTTVAQPHVESVSLSLSHSNSFIIYKEWIFINILSGENRNTHSLTSIKFIYINLSYSVELLQSDCDLEFMFDLDQKFRLIDFGLRLCASLSHSSLPFHPFLLKLRHNFLSLIHTHVGGFG